VRKWRSARNVSATWYTWLEQGRGGAPSADVLERIARALMLMDVEREHLFLLALGRPPEVRYRAVEGVSPRLQRILDAFENSAAIVRTATWDVVAWNRVATVVLTDYAEIVPEERNILRMIFCNPRVRAAQHHWESVARYVVAAFRADVARAGASASVKEFVEELSRISPEFDALWRDNDVRAYGEGAKTLHHPVMGTIDFEYSSFAVDGRPRPQHGCLQSREGRGCQAAGRVPEGARKGIRVRPIPQRPGSVSRSRQDARSATDGLNPPPSSSRPCAWP